MPNSIVGLPDGNIGVHLACVECLQKCIRLWIACAGWSACL